MLRDEYMFGLVILTAHLIISAVLIGDLFLVSKRRGKLLWAILLLAVPFAGAAIYMARMKRKRRYYLF